LCLHPNAVREACRVLYDLPETGNWQVIVTTHSPAFIDVSRDNTTIIRVEQLDGNVSGTTIFRPTRAQLDPDDRALIKLLNHFDPYVAEFFFGGKSIIVEGDTEYTAFKYVMSLRPEKYKNVHVIRARGKATIVALIKILNHFSSGFSVLHDSDTPYTTRKGRSIKNPAWAHNEKILTIINSRPMPTPVRLLASIINFETALFNDNLDDEKPYNAILQLQSYPDVLSNVELLLDSLLDHSIEPPIGICEWNSIEQLEEYALIRSPSQVASTNE